MNIYEIIAKAQALKDEKKIDSVSPSRVGALIEDTLKYINEYQLLSSSPMMHKTYASVSAMQSDAAPVSDLTGKAMKKGQLVVIVPADSSDTTAGDVYRYDGPSGNTSAWTFILTSSLSILLLLQGNIFPTLTESRKLLMLHGASFRITFQ